MKAEIPYETALARHPNEVAAVMAMIAKSRSKDPDCDPNHFVWTYSWGISFTETRSLEVRSVWIRADKGRKYGYARNAYNYTRDGAAALPPEVRAYHKEMSK